MLELLRDHPLDAQVVSHRSWRCLLKFLLRDYRIMLCTLTFRYAMRCEQARFQARRVDSQGREIKNQSIFQSCPFGKARL